ncbi:MAG: hypothetical protein FWC27_08510, partial [Firmicutes bacterium]|nr:hypothetical protein [Bacillota bacterium]
DAAVMACGGGCRLCCDPCAGTAGCTVAGSAFALQDDVIAVIDPNTHEESGSVPTSVIQPAAFAVNPSNGLFFVAQDGGLTVLDPQGNIIDTLAEHRNITDVVYNPAAGKLYLADYTYAELLIYDAETYLPVDTLLLGAPLLLAVDPASNHVYAAAPSAGIQAVSGETDSVVQTLSMPDVVSMAVDSARRRLYAADNGGTVHVVDTNDNIEADAYALPGGVPEGIAVNPNTNRLYANYGTHIDVLDAADGGFLGDISAANITALDVDQAANRVYYYTGGTETVVLDGSDDSLLGAIPMADVIEYAFSTRKLCGAGTCGLFTAGSPVALDNMSGMGQGDLVSFGYYVDRRMELGNDITEINPGLFRVDAAGVYEIGLRMAVETLNPDSYDIAYSLLVNDDTANPLYYRRWGMDPNQATVADYVQLFQPLQTGDVLSVRLTVFTADISSHHELSSYITIRKIC